MPKKEKQLRGKAFMDELDRRIQALTPEDMLDTSEEDAQTAKNFKMAAKLHKEEVPPQKDKAILSGLTPLPIKSLIVAMLCR
jgi:hypothetical protein